MNQNDFSAANALNSNEKEIIALSNLNQAMPQVSKSKITINKLNKRNVENPIKIKKIQDSFVSKDQSDEIPFVNDTNITVRKNKKRKENFEEDDRNFLFGKKLK